LKIEPRDFRHALSCFASGVCVITTQNRKGEELGVTISSFCSLSLEPPLVLFCLGKSTRNIDVYAESSVFVVNILAADQIDISENFASQYQNKFKDVCYVKGKNGCPTLPGCVATLECTLVNKYDGGDHFILVGQVTFLNTSESGSPLLRYRGSYGSITLNS